MPGHSRKQPITMPVLDPKAIGRRIRRLRKARGWNLYDLSRITAIPRMTIACYECGVRVPRRDNLILLSIALRRSMAWILFELAKRGELYRLVDRGGGRRRPKRVTR